MENHAQKTSDLASLRVESASGKSAIVHVGGAWRIGAHAQLLELVALGRVALPLTLNSVRFECTQLQQIDTAGAMVLKALYDELAARKLAVEWQNVPTHSAGLLERVMLANIVPDVQNVAPSSLISAVCAPIGKALVESWRDLLQIIGFLGAVLQSFGAMCMGKIPFRRTSMVFHMQQAGLNAVPIVALISFLIGAIVAQQGAYQLRRFGADVFTVNLVGVLVLREIGVLLTAIMFAGRSGSAFTAEIGAMKMREEIDALRVMGRDPVHVLVVPRLCALVLSLPLLTIISDFAALFGAMIVSWVYIGLEPTAFLVQLREAIALKTVLTGLSKAPFMALFIGIIACLEGMKVQGSADSLGQQTTSSVVKSIFVVLVLDGIFAMIFAALEW